ncbi:MAG: NAD(P)-dependent oxidoreductase [Myxococcales bacterium]|nr:NAD(P)-dependent oxidoreductase [Myxococcales bacterium]
MTVLVTGASGFLGSHIVEQLAQSGRPVRALVRKTSNTKFLESLENVELAYGSVDDQESVLAAADGVEAIIHAAGLVKARGPAEFWSINTEGTQNMLTAALRQKDRLKRFVLVSSQAAGGPSDASGTPVRVGQETVPVTNYGRSKLAAEQATLALQGELPVTILRPPAIYGPRDREILIFFKSVAKGVLPLTNPLSAKYSMIYGPDCASACIRAVDADVPSGSTFYLDDGEPVTFEEMIHAVEQALGTRAWMRLPLPRPVVRTAALFSELYGKVTNQAVMLTRDKCNELFNQWVCDGNSVREKLSWQPTVQFFEGVKLTAAWYKQAGWL